MLIYILVASIFSSLAIGLGDKNVRLPDGNITLIPGMLMDGIRAPKELFNGFALIAIIFGILGYYKIRPFKNFYFALALAWCFFVSFISRYEFSYYFLFYMFLGTFAIILLSSVELKQEEIKNISKKVIKAVAIVGLVNLFYCVLQVLCLDQFFRVKSANFLYRLGDGSFTHRLVGFIGNPSLLSIFLAFILPVYLYIKERWAYFTFILALFVIFLCESSTGYIVALSTILFYLFFNNKKVFVTLIILLTIIGSIFTGLYFNKCKSKFDDLLNGTGRTQVWLRGIDVWRGKNNNFTTSMGAITGHGLRSWEYEIGQKEQNVHNQWREAHNDYLQIAFETGIVGITLYLMFILYLFKIFLSDITKEKSTMMACLVGFAISGFTLFPLYSSCMILFTIIFVGLILNKKGE